MRAILRRSVLAVMLGAALIVGTGVVSGAASTKSIFCKAATSVPVTHDISTGNIPTAKTSIAGVKADSIIAKSIEAELKIMVSTAPGAKVKSVIKKAEGVSSQLVGALGLLLSGDEEIASGVFPKGGSASSAKARIKFGAEGANGETSLLISVMGSAGNALAKVCPALRVYQQ
jgi:hypothetical protein